MKYVMFKRRFSEKHHRKVMSIQERSDDKDCQTQVRKSFAYVVSCPQQKEVMVENPEIYIKKCFDTKLRQERFSFRVKGAFFIKQHKHVFQVNFCHTLRIELTWKDKTFSPKKSATLT